MSEYKMEALDFDEKFRKARLDQHFDEALRLFIEKYQPKEDQANCYFHVHINALLRTYAELAVAPHLKHYQSVAETLTIAHPFPAMRVIKTDERA